MSCSWRFVVLCACVVSSVSAACTAALTGTVTSSTIGYTRSLASVPAADNDETNKVLLIGGGEDQKLRVWELSGTGSSVTSALANTLGSVHGTIWSLSWSSSLKLLASGSGDGVIRLWPLSVLVADKVCVGLSTSAACAGDSRCEWTGAACQQGTGVNGDKCCDGDGLGCQGEYKVDWRDAAMTKNRQVFSVAWISATKLASGWGDAKIRIWTYTATPDGTTGKRLAFESTTVMAATGRPYSLVYLGTPARLASTSPDWQKPELWDTTLDTTSGSTASVILETDVGLAFSATNHLDGVNVVVADATGEKVMTGGIDYSIKVWTVGASTKALDKTLDGHTADTAYTTSLAFISDDVLASGGGDGKLKFWNPSGASTVEVQSLDSVQTGRISSLVWIGTINTLASASYDLSIKILECA